MSFAGRPAGKRQIAVVVLTGLALSALVGACGSGGGEGTASSTDRPVREASRTDRQASRADRPIPSHRQGTHRQPGERGSPDRVAAAAGKEKPVSGAPRSSRSTSPQHRSDGPCGRRIGRAECLANTHAAKHSTPGHPVDSPKQCLQVAGRSQCAKIAEDELAASDQDGHSFRPKECLRYYSREQCTALLDSQMPR